MPIFGQDDFNKLPVPFVYGDFGLYDPLNAWSGAGKDILAYAIRIGNIIWQIGWTAGKPDQVFFRQRALTGEAWTQWSQVGTLQVVPAGPKEFIYNETPTAPPAAGQLRLNQAQFGQTFASLIYVSNTDA